MDWIILLGNGPIKDAHHNEKQQKKTNFGAPTQLILGRPQMGNRLKMIIMKPSCYTYN